MEQKKHISDFQGNDCVALCLYRLLGYAFGKKDKKKARCISGHRGHQGFSWRKKEKEYIQMLKVVPA